MAASITQARAQAQAQVIQAVLEVQVIQAALEAQVIQAALEVQVILREAREVRATLQEARVTLQEAQAMAALADAKLENSAANKARLASKSAITASGLIFNAVPGQFAIPIHQAGGSFCATTPLLHIELNAYKAF